MKMILLALFTSIMVEGQVLSVEDKTGIPYAAIKVVETRHGTTADEHGCFKLVLPESGHYTIEVSALGYRKKVVHFEAIEGQTVKLRIGLQEEVIQLKEIIVTPGSFSVTDEAAPDRGVLTTMDVYLTPGSAADLMMTLQALLGLNNVGDNAAVSVQGGELDELVVRVNGLRLPHPFHYESGGGIFSMLDETMLSKSDFYAGGYPAQFGGALSGVLDIKLKSFESGTDGSFDLSMAGAGISFHHNGFRLSATRSYFDILARIFGMGEGFTSYPESWDIHSVYSIPIKENAILTAFIVAGGDHVGIDLTDEGFSGELQDSDTKGLVGSNIVVSKEKWTLNLAFGANFRNHRWEFTEGWFWDTKDREFELNAEISCNLSTKSLIGWGINVLRGIKHFEYEVPEDSIFMSNPDAEHEIGERNIRDWLVSGYVLHRRFLTGSLIFEAGLRGEHYTYTGKSIILPRLALAYKLAPDVSLRLGTGLYSQIPGVEYIDSVFGNPELDFNIAKHITIALERNIKPLILKVQTFYKRYEHLPVEWGDSYKSSGTGRSYGLELFAKLIPQGRWMGWISYTYLRSLRAIDSTLTEYPSNFDTPHILTVVGNYDPGKGWQIGFKAKYSTGRPYTPLIGRVEVARDVYRPIYGEYHSERYPDYFRLDIRLTKISQLFGHPCISYWEFLNITNHENIEKWVYSVDNSEQKAAKGFGRMFVGGVILKF